MTNRAYEWVAEGERETREARKRVRRHRLGWWRELWRRWSR